MCIAVKGRVLVIKKNRAIVEIEGGKKTVNVRPDLKIKSGDMVMIAFNTIVDKIS